MSIKILERRESIGLTLSHEYTEEMEDTPEDTACGTFGYYPKWLQKLNTPKSFLVINAVLGLLNGATFTYFIGCISTLEKRFAFESKITGVIMIAEEFGPVCLGFFIGYFGGRSHRPRLMSIVMLVGFISSFVMASPHFLFGPIRDSSELDHYKNATDFELCDHAEKNHICNKFPTINAVSIFFIGTLLKGIACTAFYTIGTPYLDDNIKKKNTAMYFAFSLAIQLLGPVTGFLLSSLCLQFYEDPFYDPGYGTDDPRWIGAWWLGYVVIGILMFIFSIPMWLFPRRFPGVKVPKALEKSEEESMSLIGVLKDMGNALKRLFKNPILMCSELSGILRCNGVVGYFILMPKYMEMQFKQSASKANLLSGPISLVGMMCGIFLGGCILQKIKPGARYLTGAIVFAESFSLLALLISMQITCTSVNENISTTNILLQFENQCNADCLCTTKYYTPICGPDEKTTYFSPCHAGCSSYNKTLDDEEVYYNCTCVHNKEGDIVTGTSTNGYCNFECQWLIAYIVVISMGKFISSLASVPGTVVFFRCVNPEDKSVALGMLSGMYSILAFIPMPLLYGALSDSCCLVWDTSCGKTGNCWVYDVDKFRYMLHGVSSIFIFLSFIMNLIVWCYSHRLKNLYGEEDEKDQLKLGEKPSNGDGHLSTIDESVMNDSSGKLVLESGNKICPK